MFTNVFNVAVLKSIISLNLVMNTEQESEVTETIWSTDHYEYNQSLRFDSEDIKNLEIPEKIRYAGNDYKVSGYKCTAKIHSPQVFSHLRSMSGITNEMVSESFDVVSNLATLKSNSGNEGGRSASFFYFSNDRRFLIKTINRGEKKFFLQGLLADYHRHVIDHDDSLLSRIVGVFSFKFQDNTKSRVLLQINIFPKVELIGIFDLKGSKLDRSSGRNSNGVVSIKSNVIYKDLDFLNTKKKIFLEEADVQKLKISIFKDSFFLNQHNIIDYSLLLGISYDYSNQVRPFVGSGSDRGLYFYAGIIDYLQTYNTFKQLEAFSKNLLLINVPKEDISVISSDQYSDRFSSFLCSILAI